MDTVNKNTCFRFNSALITFGRQLWQDLLGPIDLKKGDKTGIDYLVKVLCPIQHKIGQFRDALPEQSAG